MMSRVNYRRGLQRLYLLLTSAWICGVVLFLPAERWNFWRKWDVFDQFAAKPCSKETPCTNEELKSPWITERMAQAERLQTESRIDAFYEYITLSVPVESRLERFFWLMGLLFLPPALGYAALFFVAPWIFRGFKSPKQHSVRMT